MNTESLKKQIDDFRALSTEAAITPETLGTLLQSMADAIGTAALQTDLNNVTAGVKSATNTSAVNISALQSWRTDITAAPNILQSMRLGTVNKVSVALSATLKSLTTGGNTSVANAVALPAATADTAGIMTAAQVQSLGYANNQVLGLQKSLSEVALKVPTSFAYLSSPHSLVARNSDGSQLFSVDLPLATSEKPGLMTAGQVRQFNEICKNVSDVDDDVSALSKKVPASFTYSSSTRMLALKNAEGSSILGATLPLATASTAGLMTTKAVTDVQTALNTRVMELGNFGSEEEALNKLKEPAISGNAQIVVVHLTYQTHMGITMMQNIVNDFCRQIIFNHDKVYHRAIYFTNSKRDTINYAEDWSCLFMDRLVWDGAAHKYVPSLFGVKFNASYTDAIPLASTTADGLMSKEDKAKLAQLENKLNALLGVQS